MPCGCDRRVPCPPPPLPVAFPPPPARPPQAPWTGGGPRPVAPRAPIPAAWGSVSSSDGGVTSLLPAERARRSRVTQTTSRAQGPGPTRQPPGPCTAPVKRGVAAGGRKAGGEERFRRGPGPASAGPDKGAHGRPHVRLLSPAPVSLSCQGRGLSAWPWPSSPPTPAPLCPWLRGPGSRGV